MNHGFSIGDSVATTAAALGNGHIVGFKTDITNGQRFALVRIISLNPMDVRETPIPVQELKAPHMNLTTAITHSNHCRLNNSQIPDTPLGNILVHICNQNKSLALYVARYIAFVLRNPDKRMDTALIIGGAGAGKSLFFTSLCRVMSAGIYSGKIRIEGTHQLDSSFTPYLDEEVKLIIFEERGHKTFGWHLQAIKGLITSETIELNRKMQKQKTIPALVSVILLSNNLSCDISRHRRLQSIQCTAPLDPRNIIGDPGSDTEFCNWLLTKLDLTDFSSSSTFA